MKKILCIFILFLAHPIASASSNCFIAAENGSTIIQEGDCKTRYAPASTFKIPLSLMGYDSKILESETSPEWPFKEGYDLFINVCKGPHNPRTWMRDSCLWYSRVLTQKLGMDKFKAYVIKFNYGNQDVSGDKGKNNGLTHSWLSSSLEISPEEQTIFLQKFLNHELQVSEKAYTLTKKLLYKEELSGGWKLYGKSGNGMQLSFDRTQKLDLQHGWFVGWIEKNGRSIMFASHITDDKKYDVFASFRARNEAQNKLWKLINELEK